jgi:hypothetical protein
MFPDLRAGAPAAAGARLSRLAALAGVLCLLACGDPPPAATAEAPSVASEAAAPAPALIPRLPEPWIDLVAEADGGHVRRGGVVIDPGAPGWSRATGAGGWLPVRALDGRTVALPDGIGATLQFPVGDEGPDLRELSIWMRPLANGQRVSLFLDGKALTTISVRGEGREYRVRLPARGLAPGEHSLRFYFRLTRFIGRERSAAAIDDVRLLPEGDAPPLADAWTGRLGDVPALFAGPPASWSFYAFLPPEARFVARAVVTAGGPVEFAVRVDADGEPTQVVSRTEVAAGATADLDVDLSPWSGRPVRLSLETAGPVAALGEAGWARPAIAAPRADAAAVPPVRNVLVWVVDGLRDDRVALGRGGDHAHTPNLDLLAAEGAAAVGVWSGGASPEEGHRRLLAPATDAPSLATLMAGAGRTTGYLTTSAGTVKTLTAEFGSGLDLRAAGEPAETRVVLREVDAWLATRKRHPFFLYVATVDARAPFQPAPGYARLYERARPAKEGEDAEDPKRNLRAAYDAQVSTADYWVGQAVALLSAHGIADETAVVVTGSVGQELRERGGLGDGHALVPELLSVPLVVWHPALRSGSRARPLLAGGDLADVGATTLALAGAQVPPAWPGRPLLGALFEGRPILPRPSRAQLGNQFAGRYGTWLLRGATNRDTGLWNLAADPLGREDLAPSHPIALRVLRDALVERRERATALDFEGPSH